MRDEGCEFLSGDTLSRAIKAILREDNAKAAVAFWGRGSDGHVVGAGARIICNLSTGGTNPHAIRRLSCPVRHLGDLHAKVYLAADRAVVASANASANGLGLEGTEQAFWREAGVLTRHIAAIETWFEALWNDAEVVTDKDLKAAETVWAGRRSVRPPLRSFSDFDPSADDVPLVAWLSRAAPWDLNEEAFAGLEPSARQNAEERADRGIEVSGTLDAELLPDRWILFFHRTATERLDRRTRPWFAQAGNVVVKRAFRYQGDDMSRDVILAPERERLPPFDPADERFVAAFQRVVEDPRLAVLLGGDDENVDWYAHRLDEMRLFWRLMKDAYQSDW